MVKAPELGRRDARRHAAERFARLRVGRRHRLEAPSSPTRERARRRPRARPRRPCASPSPAAPSARRCSSRSRSSAATTPSGASPRPRSALTPRPAPHLAHAAMVLSAIVVALAARRRGLRRAHLRAGVVGLARTTRRTPSAHRRDGRRPVERRAVTGAGRPARPRRRALRGRAWPRSSWSPAASRTATPVTEGTQRLRLPPRPGHPRRGPQGRGRRHQQLRGALGLGADPRAGGGGQRRRDRHRPVPRASGPRRSPRRSACTRTSRRPRPASGVRQLAARPSPSPSGASSGTAAWPPWPDREAIRAGGWCATPASRYDLFALRG